MTNWKPGDRALLPVRVTNTGENCWTQIAVGYEADGYYLSVNGADLIPDDRSPEWLPGQAGDVAEWGGHRWGCDTTTKYRWYCMTGPVACVADDNVPADAVLILKAKSREQ